MRVIERSRSTSLAGATACTPNCVRRNLIKDIVITILITLAIAPPAIYAVEPEDPIVVFDTDFAIPEMRVGDGSGTPVCIDEPSGLFVAGCEGAVGPQGEQGDPGEPGAGVVTGCGVPIGGTTQLANDAVTSITLSCGTGELAMSGGMTFTEDPFCGIVVQNGPIADGSEWIATIHNNCGIQMTARFYGYCCSDGGVPEVNAANRAATIIWEVSGN